MLSNLLTATCYEISWFYNNSHLKHEEILGKDLQEELRLNSELVTPCFYFAAEMTTSGFLFFFH